MVEAMACGTPVIGTRWSGPAEFLTEENGYPLRTDGLVPNHGAVCSTTLVQSVITLS
jgi:glycosyltransferase involved in cell wall biosynthesis